MHAAAQQTVEPHRDDAGAQSPSFERGTDRRSLLHPYQSCRKGDSFRQGTNRPPAARTSRVHAALGQKVAGRYEGGNMIGAEETDLTGTVWPVHFKPQEAE